MTLIEQGFKKAKNLTVQEFRREENNTNGQQNTSFGNNAQPEQRASYGENKRVGEIPRQLRQSKRHPGKHQTIGK